MTAANPGPPSDAEHDEMLREHSRRIIPDYCAAVRQWIAKIRADPGDIRNAPDVLTGRGGQQFVNGVTDLEGMAAHVDAIMEKFNAGDLDLAFASYQELVVRVAKVNARKDAKALAAGRKTVEGGQRAGAQRAAKFQPRNKAILDFYLGRLAAGAVRKLALTETMAEFGRGRTAVWDAIRSAKKMVRDPAKPD